MAYVQEMSPGVWKITVSVPHVNPRTGKHAKLAGRAYGGQKAIKAKTVELEGRAANYVYPKRDGPVATVNGKTVAELFEAWTAKLEQDGKSPNYIRIIRSKAKCHILPEFGDDLLTGVTGEDLDIWYGRLAGTKSTGPLSAASIDQLDRILSSAYSQAWRWRWVASMDDIPTKRATAPRVPKPVVVEPEVEDVIALIEAAKNSSRPELALVLWLAGVTGMRRAEQCGLRIANFDFKKVQVDIEGSVAYVNGKRIVIPVKDEKPRTVGLDPVTMAMVADHISAMQDRAKAAGTELAKDAFLFSDAADCSHPWDPDAVSKWFAKIRKSLGMELSDEDIKLHGLRHFMATHGLDMGYGVSVVAGRNGHDPAVMLKVYARALPRADRELSADLSRLLTPEPASTWAEQPEAGPSFS